jgi:hypothetical protein
MKDLVHLKLVRREKVTPKVTAAIFCGILAVFLLEVFAVLAWA